MEDIIRFHKTFGEKLGIIKSALERAIILNIAATKSHHFKDKHTGAISAASIYLVSRTSNTPYTLKGLSEACNVPRKDIARCYRLLIRTKDEFQLASCPNAKETSCCCTLTALVFLPNAQNVLAKSLLYHDTTDVFRCSNCNAAWKRFE